MRANIPGAGRKHLAVPNFAHVATMMDDGAPRISPVWVDVDGGHPPSDTADACVRPRNVRRDPRVALSAANWETYPYGEAGEQRLIVTSQPECVAAHGLDYALARSPKD